MNLKSINWYIWAGFLLSFIAASSYPLIFVWFPVTRDFPWANLVLFGGAAVLLFIGMRRAFSPDRVRPTRSKIVGSVLTVLSCLVFGIFMFAGFIAARWLPASTGHPQVGQRAPDFALAGTEGKSYTLGELMSAPVNGKPLKGVLLVFYRGYW